MNTVPLRRLARILNGGTPTSDEANWNGEVKWATPVDLARVDGRLIDSTERTLSALGAESGSAIAPAGSVLVSTRAPIGYTALSTQAIAFNQGCKALVPERDVDSRFLQFCLISSTPTLKASGSGSTFLELSSEALAAQLIPSIDFDLQRRIVDFLDDKVAQIDQIIAARRQQQAATAEAAKEAIRRLMTTGDRETRKTSIEWMPLIGSTWPLPRVSHVYKTGSGSTPPSDNMSYYGDEIPWVNTGDIKDGRLFETARSITQKAVDAFPTLVQYEPGSLVIAMYGQGATKGRVALLGIASCVNQACCVLRGDDDLNEWAFYWFRAHKEHIVQLAVGSGQPNLSQETIRALHIPIAPKPDRYRILAQIVDRETALSQADSAIARQISMLIEYKSSLITAAVTGEFDVTAAGSRIPG